jgi:lipopolysaccharide/colanic/teichoic acid biosynthesis glycosyltransferase
MPSGLPARPGTEPPRRARASPRPVTAVAVALSRLDPVVILGDLAVLLGGYTILLLGLDDASADPPRIAMWCLALITTWLFVGSREAYRRRILVDPLQSAYVAGKATLVSGGIFYLLPLIGGGGHSRISNLTVVVLLATAVATWRLVVARLLPSRPDELVVVGAGWAGQALADAVYRRPHTGVRVIAFVDGDPALRCRPIHGAPVRPICELTTLVHRPAGLARVVLANTGHAQAAVFDELAKLAPAGVEVVQMSSLYEQITGCVPVQHLGSYWWAVLPRPSGDVLYWFGKRLLDITFATVGVALLAILLPVLWPLLCSQTHGSFLFKQPRVGKNGRLFTLYKLRTLPVSSTESVAGGWRQRKIANQSTRLCALIRAAGLDELPQAINILRGEMSVVGPRPYVPDEVEELEQQIPFFRSRWMVLPGVTGWAQVKFGYGLSLEDEVEKLQHDLYYIGHQSTYLDLLIVVRTIANALRGRRPPSHVSLSALPRSTLHGTVGSEGLTVEQARR